MAELKVLEFVRSLFDEQNDHVRALDRIVNDSSDLSRFELRHTKELLTERKCHIFSGLPKDRLRIFVGDLLSNAIPSESSHIRLRKRFWEERDYIDLRIENGLNLYILQNNDLSGIPPETLLTLSQYFLQSKNDFLVIWDTDNHHWTYFSLLLCAISDIYVPAHLERLSVFHSINSNIPFCLPVGSRQWSVDQLNVNSELIRNTGRYPGPWGLHHFYPRFQTRSAVVRTLSDSFEGVGFIDMRNFHLDPIESLIQWSSYKTHFCACVGGDLPYRVFDGLITAGIVFVPQDLELYFQSLHLSMEGAIFYKASDLFEPEPLVQKGLARFSELHENPRYMSSLNENFHISVFFRRLLDRVFIELNFSN